MLLNICRVSSRNFILGGKLTDHGEGRVDFIGNILGGGELGQFGGGGGGGGELGQFGGGEVELFGGEASPAPPSLD